MAMAMAMATLFAIDANGCSWVIQCMCCALHCRVGPDVVRELVGAIAATDRGRPGHSSRGMIIGTTLLTPGVLTAAKVFGFEVLDGEALAAELARNV